MKKCERVLIKTLKYRFGLFFVAVNATISIVSI